MGRSKDIASGTFTTALDVQGAITSDGLTVDTSDQVIINHSGDAGGLRIDSTNNTNTGSIRFGDVADNYIGAVEYNHTTDALSFYANNATHMTIDSSGRVTMPSQPSFGVYRNAGAVTANNVYVFNGYDYNTGTMYNTSNGRGTAPVAGRYFVSTWMMCETNQEYTNYNYHIRKNGTTYKSVYSSNGGSGRHMQWSWAGTMGLATNDYIDIFTNNIRLYGSSHLYSAFCMHLLS